MNRMVGLSCNDWRKMARETKPNKTLSKPVVSGATGGPGTGAGLNYQINYAVLRLLKLFAEFFARPLGNPSVQIEPRAINDLGVTRWDLGFENLEELVEAKLNPTRADIAEWIARVYNGHFAANVKTVLVCGRIIARLKALKKLLRISRETARQAGAFLKLVALEQDKESESLLNELGSNAALLLNRMEVLEVSEQALSEQIDLYCKLLSGDKSESLRDFLFRRISDALPHRLTLTVHELVKEAEARGIRFSQIPTINLPELSQDLNEALLLLGVCPSPLPEDVIASATKSSSQELNEKLINSDAAQSVSVCEDNWKLEPSPVPLPKPNSELVERGLRALLGYIGKHKHEDLGRKQVVNALEFAELCVVDRPQIVAQMFMVLDKPLKGLGDKHLVLKAAQLAIRAARLEPRTIEEAKGEAQAIICGESWALQRIDRLDEAMIAAKKSLKLGEDIGWDRNTAYCEKCIGRLYRIMAEKELDPKVKGEYLHQSVSHLEEAIRRFQASSEFGPTHQEVGDCHSLLARTFLIRGEHNLAIDHARKANLLIPQGNNKDYLDLKILQGELVDRRDPDAAEAFYDEVIQYGTSDDSEKSEIAARAYFRRGLNRTAKKRKNEASSDFLKAQELWERLDEPENAARAAWEILKLQNTIPDAAVASLATESFAVRMTVINAHQDKLRSLGTAKVPRRAAPSSEYWRQLIREARATVAVEEPEW